MPRQHASQFDQGGVPDVHRIAGLGQRIGQFLAGFADFLANLGDFISDPSALAPDEEVTKKDLRRAVEEALDELSDREKEIVRRRFGLDDEGLPRTLEDVGREFGVTRERGRQIEAKTLAKLRLDRRIASSRHRVNRLAVSDVDASDGLLLAPGLRDHPAQLLDLLREQRTMHKGFPVLLI